MRSRKTLPALPTSVIGSYPRPWWLRKVLKLRERGLAEDSDVLEAMNDAVRAVVREQEIVGIDIPSDGEQRRDEMVEHFAKRIKGFRFYGPVRVWGNNYFNKPAVVSKLEYHSPIALEDFLFLKETSTREIVKVTVTGPYTIADWSFNEYYSTKEQLVEELAKIINKELTYLSEHGAEFIQVDEPALTTHPKEVEWAIDIIENMTKGVNAKIGLHVCYSDYTILIPHLDKLKNISQVLLEFANRNFSDLQLIKKIPVELGFGVIDVHNRNIEPPEYVAKAISKALSFISPDMLYINPDCGLKLLPRGVAKEKLKNMVLGTKIMREELQSKGYESIEFRYRL